METDQVYKLHPCESYYVLLTASLIVVAINKKWNDVIGMVIVVACFRPTVAACVVTSRGQNHKEIFKKTSTIGFRINIVKHLNKSDTHMDIPW